MRRQWLKNAPECSITMVIVAIMECLVFGTFKVQRSEKCDFGKAIFMSGSTKYFLPAIFSNSTLTLCSATSASPLSGQKTPTHYAGQARGKERVRGSHITLACR